MILDLFEKVSKIHPNFSFFRNICIFIYISIKMFSTFKVKDLKKLVSNYRQYHNIKGYSKMKKVQLVDELEKRFMIQNNQLF